VVCFRCSCTHTEFFAGFQIVSLLEDTCVEIYEVDGDKYTKLLDVHLPEAYEVYTYAGAIGEDLTGVFINASFPISLYSGHACANVPEAAPFCDHMVEQLLPVSEWGELHFVPPIVGRNENAGYVQSYT